MYSTVVAVGDNTLQTLNRIVSVLRGRNFRVVSVTTGRTHDSTVNQTTILVDSTDGRAERVVACLEKVDEVHQVEQLQSQETVCRELALLTVIRNNESAPAIDAIVSSYGAHILDDRNDALILEVVGEPQVVEAAIQSLPAGCLTGLVRVGPVAPARAHVTRSRDDADL